MGALVLMKPQRNIDQFVSDVTELISPPEVWVRINDLMDDPGSSVADVASVVSSDAALTSGLLKVANCALYGFPSKVETVSRAITVLGMHELYSIATAVTAAKAFSSIPNNIVDPFTFWKHSVSVAMLAKRIASRSKVLHPERLFVAGILHDVGALVIFSKAPEISTEFLLSSSGDEGVMSNIEMEAIGFNHAIVGARLLSSWGLPKSLIDAIRHHHSPVEAGDGLMDACILHVADAMANGMEGSSFVAEVSPSEFSVDPLVWDVLRITQDDLIDISSGISEEIEQIVSAFVQKSSVSA